jgi:glycosyltransferase involved in cell wall biosynthesis
MRVLVNGRFLGQRITGAQRYARELLMAMDTLLATPTELARRFSFDVLIPPGTTPGLSLGAMAIREVGRFRGQLWEQFALASYAGNDLLLNLCNTAPLAAPQMVSTILDASVYAVPEAYSLPFRTWYRTLIPALGRRSRRVVTISQFSRLELERYAGIPSARITVIPAGAEHILRLPADTGVIERLGLRPGGYVLAVGSSSRHKNAVGVARAAALLARTDVEVVLAGGGNPRIFAPEAATGGHPLRRTGYVSDAELRALYQHAACFVFPSFYEGFGLPPLEAMTCGCPVVVSRAASLPEVCGDAAMYCNPHDPVDIAHAIDEVIGNPALQDDLRHRGAERAAEFSWQDAARTMLDLLDGLVTQ